MGEHALLGCLGCLGVSTILGLVTIFLTPFHTLHFLLSLPPSVVATWSTYPLYMDFDWTDSFEPVIEKAVGSTAWKILKGLEGRSRVSTVEAQICQISMFIGNSMCNGLHTANLGGMGLVFCTLIMIGCFVAAGLLTYSYKNTPKKQHRETAFICICIGTLLHSIASIVYDGIVAFGMEKMHDDWPLELQILLGPDRSTGLTWGFFIVLLMIIFNVISVILHSNVKLKEEDRLVDMKRQREFENEMMEEQNAYGGYNSHGYAGAGVASRYTGHAGGQPQVSYNYGWPQPANTGAYGGYGMHQQRAW